MIFSMYNTDYGPNLSC